MRTLYEILRSKRDGQELSAEEIRYLVAGLVSGDVREYQAAAFLMAAAIRGLSTSEAAALTEAMRDSGEVWDLSDLAPVVDKHSTGGVGDKTTLVLAPLVAAAGARVGMMSGRGLGHTGGTLDKLATIPGFRTSLSREEVRQAIQQCGAALFAQTEAVARADRILYSLRDVTGTVESLPLIVASILSKKLASGTTGIVFDVKTGNGAFLKTMEEARALGRALIDTSRAAGKEAAGLITDMSRPLGRAVGNALEAEEAIRVLRGDGPKEVADLCLALGLEMLRFAEPGIEPVPARANLRKLLSSGEAARKFEKIIEQHGGDPSVVEHPEKLPQPRRRSAVKAARAGFVRSIATERMGFRSIDIGCGRHHTEDAIDPAAGFLVEKTVGDRVEAGEILLTICYGHTEPPRESYEEEIAALFEIGDDPVTPEPLVRESL